MNVPVLLRNARAAAGLTQAEADKRAGTAHSALSSYEGGVEVPTAETVARVIGARATADLSEDARRCEIACESGISSMRRAH